MQREVEIEAKKQIKALLKNKQNGEELNRYLTRHERFPLMVKNLCGEVVKLEQRAHSKHLLMSRDTIIKEVVKMFVSAAILHADEQNLSDAERFRRGSMSKKEHAIEEMREVIKEIDETGMLKTID